MHPQDPMTAPRASRTALQATQYEVFRRKRVLMASFMIFVLIPATMVFGVVVLDQNMYMIISLLVVIYTLIPFFMVFEARKPKAREIVLIAMMAALTVVLQLFFHVTVPIQAGTAMVIISGIALGPEAGFLVGALARLVCNFYIGQGPWTPWQMFCWGLLGFLAGLAFNKIDPEDLRKYRQLASEKINTGARKLPGPLMKVNSRSFRVVMGPVICILFAIALAYVCWLIWPGSGENGGFIGWRLYIFGAAGLLAGVLLQRKRLPADGLTMALFTFFVTFIVYGGIMNVCAMVNASIMPGGDPISLSTLRLLYITGVPYDAVHAATAAVFIFLFGDLIIRKLERVKIKYGIYR